MWGMQKTILMIVAVALVGCSVYELPSGGGEPQLKRNVVKIKKIKRPDAGRIRINLGDILKEYEAKPNSDPIIEKAVRKQLKKPTGKLTKVDLEYVTVLDLSGTQISDTGLKEVAKLKRLIRLYLSNTKITDADLKELSKLKQLKWLSS